MKRKNSPGHSPVRLAPKDGVEIYYALTTAKETALARQIGEHGQGLTNGKIGPRRWLTIHRALRHKYAKVQRGDYFARTQLAAVVNNAWAEHLHSILQRIGPAGQRAAVHGVQL